MKKSVKGRNESLKSKSLPVESPDSSYMFFMRHIPCQEDFCWVSNIGAEQFKINCPNDE
ncbi:MAG: hypothetical protein JXC36_00895 [Candidatus Atribacteria bacterium]|nr:hypothetical protein [Candidatus Atribacteria bacterium]